MKTERLVILVSPEEKAQLQKLARRAEVSVAELVRAELPLAGRFSVSQIFFKDCSVFVPFSLYWSTS